MHDDKSPITVYDATAIYDDQILPLVDKIREICILKKIPFFITAAVKSTDEDTEYKNDGILTGSTDIHLKDDRFTKFLLICRGAEVKSPFKGMLETEDAQDYITTPPMDDMDEADDDESDIDIMVPTEEEMNNPPQDSLQHPKEANEVLLPGIEFIGDL